MAEKVAVCVAQINSTVGDFEGNVRKIISCAEKASREGAQILLTPELSLCGCLAQDLLLREDFQAACYEHLMKLVEESARFPELLMVVGLPLSCTTLSDISGEFETYVNAPEELEDEGLFNAAVFIQNGFITFCYLKGLLAPVEEKYFLPGEGGVFVFKVNGQAFGFCFGYEALLGPFGDELKDRGVKNALIMGSFPYGVTEGFVIRSQIGEEFCSGLQTAFYAGPVGFQDGVLFEGASFAMQGKGRNKEPVGSFLPSFKECSEVFTLISEGKLSKQTPETKYAAGLSALYDGLVYSVKDYCEKNGFKQAVLGLSGGIDSALVLKLAVDALGAENVLAVHMPSKYTSKTSTEDAQKLARRLNVRYEEIPIEEGVKAFQSMLAPQFSGLSEDITEENIQARVRGTLLMALSNKFGYLVLATGNKSEMCVGYATLYGDLAGGFAPIKDVYKTAVYLLCNMVNQREEKPVFPKRMLTRAPSAELRENQKDEDSLAPYAVLDEILLRAYDEHLSAEEIIEDGFDRQTVCRVFELIRKSEYKRRQAPLGPSVGNSVLDGSTRDMPVTNHFNPCEC